MGRGASHRSLRWGHRALIGGLAFAGALVGQAGGHTASAQGTTYYVDALAGSDSNSGTSSAQPWQTLAKVDATTFQPGDQVLFHAGQTWNGQLAPQGSGAPGAPITLSSYGTGARPYINGNSVPSGTGAIYLNNQSWWTINGFEVTSNNGQDNFGATTAGSWRSGIWVDNSGLGLVSGITITNNDVHDVNGCFACTQGDGHANGGIALLAYQNVGGDSFNDVLISGNTVSNVGREGISVMDDSTASADPFHQADLQSSMSTNVAILNNTVTYTDADGITDIGTEGALIQGNVVGHPSQKSIVGNSEASSGGIWNTHTIDTTEQFNEVYGTLTQTVDGTGFDNDLSARDTKIQYNYSHDNQGGFLLMEGTGLNQPPPSNGLIVRYNLSVNDAYSGQLGVFDFAYGGTNNTLFENNTVYIPAGSPANPMYCLGCNSTETFGTTTFRNNIVEDLGTGSWTYPGALNGASFDHNVFYGNSTPTLPPDAYAITSDPLLVAPPASAPSGLCNVSGYEVAAGSPAIGTGAVDPANGGVDYFGRPLSPTVAPTRGFYEATSFSNVPALTDTAASFIVSGRHTPNLVIDSSQAASGGGYRFAAGDALPATVAWIDPGMTTFSATVYQVPADPTQVTFWASADGITYTQVPTLVTPGSGPTAEQVSPQGSLPSGTLFLLAQIATPGVSPDAGSANSAGVTTSGVPPQEYAPIATTEIGTVVLSGHSSTCPPAAAPSAARILGYARKARGAA